MRWLVLVMVADVATLSASAHQQPSTLDDLAKAEALWKSQAPRSYEFTLEVICPGLCVPLPKPPAVFRVSDGVSKQVGGGAIEAPAQPSFDRQNSVEKLFDMIRSVASRKPYKLTVEYDPKLGYPASMSWDMREDMSDDQLTIRVTGFKIIPSK